MSAKKQVVRKLNAAPLADFDEHWWPVTLLLLTSAGALAGFVITQGNFQTAVWYENAQFQLVALGVTVFALIVGVALLRGSAQRRLQLGVFLSLLFHVGLLFTGRHVYLKYFAPPRTTEVGPATEDLVTLPDYLPTESGENSPSSLTRPQETAPRQEQDLAVTQEDREPIKAEKEAVEEPKPQEDPVPKTTELARVELPPPRQNEVVSGQKLSRQELPDKMQADAVPQPQLNRSAELTSSMQAQSLDSRRVEMTSTPAQRLQAREPRPQDRPLPDLAPVMLTRQATSDQLASIDARANLDRPIAEASPAAQQAPMPRAPAAAQPSPNLSPSMQPTPLPTRQQSSAAVGLAAPVSSPLLTMSPAAASAAALSKAETPEPAETENFIPTPSRSMQRSTASAAGAESVQVQAPTATAAEGAAGAADGALESSVASLERGNQGSPQSLMTSGSSVPSPVGQGSGPTVGSSSIGPRRALGDTAATGESAGQAGTAGRSGRERSSATATIVDAGAAGGAMAGAAGATPRPGNAVEGAPLGLTPATSAAGSSLGQRTSNVAGTALRPPGGGAPTVGNVGTGGSSAGALVGGNGTGGSANGTVGARRDVGDVAGGAPASGGNTREKQTPGDALTALPGAGVVAMPDGSATGRSTTGGTAAQSLQAAAGADGVQRRGNGLPVLVAAPEGPGGLTSRPSRDIGQPYRRPRADGEVAHLDPSRMVPENLAGSATGSTSESLTGGRRARRDDSDELRDRHGNLKGSAHDLIVDGQMRGERIMIVAFYNDEEIQTSPLFAALESKGYGVERLTAALPPVEDFARQLDGARQLWLISSEVNRLPAPHLKALLDRWRSGKLALCLLVDNVPFTAEALTVLNAISPNGTTITGDYLGEQKLKARQTNTPGFDAKLPIFHNVETLFEGTTISNINSRFLTPVCFASNGKPLIGIYEQQGAGRLLVHCGFTSIYERFWDDAGVSRFAVNVAGWLSEADKKPAPLLPPTAIPR